MIIRGERRRQHRVVLIPDDEQKCAKLEISYTVGDAADAKMMRTIVTTLSRLHPLLTKPMTQVIAATNPRLSTIDALIDLLLMDVRGQEGF